VNLIPLSSCRNANGCTSASAKREAFVPVQSLYGSSLSVYNPLKYIEFKDTCPIGTSYAIQVLRVKHESPVHGLEKECSRTQESGDLYDRWSA
jgi:hypothetical protein